MSNICYCLALKKTSFSNSFFSPMAKSAKNSEPINYGDLTTSCDLLCDQQHLSLLVRGLSSPLDKVLVSGRFGIQT